MREELIVKSKRLRGATDLTLLAPLKSGLVPALDSLTYKTRAKRLLKILHLARVSAQEYALIRPLSDSVDRVTVIHSVRVAVLEPEDKILLAVSFDGSWETYIRVLWQRVGPLLDLIFCNTQDYVTSFDHSFEDWAAWVARVQVETDFFFSTPGLTVRDVPYLQSVELTQRRADASAGLATKLAEVRLATQSAEQQAWDIARHLSPAALSETARQGFTALSVIYRLAAAYLPGTDDGEVLHRAARDALLEFVRLCERVSVFQPLLVAGRQRFAEETAWLLRQPRQRDLPPLPMQEPAFDHADVQAGIVRPLTNISHGVLLLLALDSAAAGDRLLSLLRQAPDGTGALAWLCLSTDASATDTSRPVVNLGISAEGLRVFGLAEAELALFPPAFREGMEARAGVLGDLRGNHPRRWHLPLDSHQRPVPMSAVHLVLQFRLTDPVAPGAAASKALNVKVKAFAHWAKADGGVILLAQQPLRRLLRNNLPIEHFGFADGNIDTSPITPNPGAQIYDPQVFLGDALCGYDNAGGFAADPQSLPEGPARQALTERLGWLRNGSFMVVRKLRQDVAAWLAMLDKGSTDTGVPPDQLGSKLIGRSLDGQPLVTSAGGRLNDFDYDDDAQGRQCPLHAHVRRANPRSRDSLEVPSPVGGRAPRLLRRGMSYGPTWDEDKATDERGLVFMAYNADISEQFEAIQRWLTGGNSTNGYSGQSDPMLGVPEAGKPRVFAFEDDAGQAQRVLLDGSGVSLGDEQPLVRLEWGMYLFTPSIAAVDKLRATARRNAMVGEVLWSAARGERELTQLLTQTLALPAADAAQAWKAALEDPDAQDLYRSASIWAAIRQRHGGVLRTPYGVLVAEAGAARRVLSDECHFSVGGYRERMRKSMGDIFLGMDTSGTDPVLAAKVLAINQAIKAITRDKAFVLARQATQAAIIRFVVPEVGAAALQGRPGWELDVNIRELLDDVLATVCEAWFGLANNLGTLARGGARWDWLGHQPPLYPGHFTAPSRYIFQPLPGATVESYGQSYGAALSEAVTRMVKAHRAAGTRPSQLLTAGKAKACLTEAIYDQFDDPALPDRDATIARTLVGTVMGFVPTADGSIRRVLNEWLRDGNFWALRERVLALGSGASRKQLEAILLAPMSQTMQLRPSPELVWRTAIAPTQLGPVRVEAGDQVVVGLVSVTQQSLENGVVDVMPIFGGQRWPADGSAVGAAGSPGAPAAAAACPYAAATASAAGCPVTGAGAAASAALPPHACPGQQAAMGLLLGFIGGLSEFALLPKALTKLPADLPASIRPSPVPLALHLEGALRPASAGAAETVSASTPNALAAQARDLAPPTPPPPPTGPWLLADGDSWFDYWNVPGVEPNDPNLKPCVLTLLRDVHGYQIEELADAGDLLSATASAGQLAQFSALLKRMMATGRVPKALLLSGGGNDVVAERLFPIVLTKDKAPAKGSLLSPTDLTQTIDVGLANTLRTILRHWLAARNALLPVGQRPPILLHGYDYPIPDGRNAFGVVDFEVSSWLGAVFHQCGYSDVEDRKRIDAATHELIDRLNAMQQAVAQEFNAAMKPMDVIHIDLRNTLRGSAAPPYRFDDYKTQWDNELHPTRAGFAKIAEEFAAVIAALQYA